MAEHGDYHGREAVSQREWAPQLPASPRVRRVIRRLLQVISLTCLLVAVDLLVSDQGDCVDFCTPAMRAIVLVTVAGGSALLAFIVGARRASNLLLAAAALVFCWAFVLLH